MWSDRRRRTVRLTFRPQRQVRPQLTLNQPQLKLQLLPPLLQLRTSVPSAAAPCEPPVGISPHNYSSAVAKNKYLADSNKTRTSTKPTNNQSAPRSFHPTECRSHSGPRQPFAALTRDHLTPEAGTNCHRLA